MYAQGPVNAATAKNRIDSQTERARRVKRQTSVGTPINQINAIVHRVG
jgi:hypothetical protein